MRLGERLLQSGHLTAAQLEQGLRTQTALSGRIGTNLIELGFVYADAVSAALAQQKGVPAARRKHFDAADQSLKKLVPRHLAERLGAIPLATATRFGRELVVAFLDPDDIQAIEEVSRYAGMKVRPSVAAEFYIIEYLEKLYGVPPRRMLRTQTAGRSQPTRAFEDDAPGEESAEFGMPEPVPASAAGKPTPRRERLKTAELDAGWDMLSEALPAAPAPAAELAPPPAFSQSMPATAVSGAMPATASSGAMPGSPLSGAVPATALSGSMPASGLQAGGSTPGQAFAAIANAASRDAVGDALLGYLRNFSAGLVLVCRQGLALGWRGHAPGADPAALEALSLPLSVPSIFEIAYRQRNVYLGPPPDAGATIQFRLWKLLHCDEPQQVIVCPVVIGDRVINLLYAHADGELPPSAAPDLTSLAAAAGETYVRFIQQRKL